MLTLGPAPDEETLTGFWNGDGSRDRRKEASLLDPRPCSGPAGGRLSCLRLRAQGLGANLGPVHTGQPLQSGLFSMNSTIPKE